MHSHHPATSIEEQLRSYQLTQREREIVLLLVQGLSNKEIAKHCYISEQTVKDHLKHVFSKVGVHHRAMLISTLLRFPAASDLNGSSVAKQSKEK